MGFGDTDRVDAGRTGGGFGPVAAVVWSPGTWDDASAVVAPDAERFSGRMTDR